MASPLCALPIVKERIAWSVGLSVGLSPSEPCKNAEAIEMPFASTTLVGPRNHLLHIARLNAQYLPSYRLIC